MTSANINRAAGLLQRFVRPWLGQWWERVMAPTMDGAITNANHKPTRTATAADQRHNPPLANA